MSTVLKYFAKAPRGVDTYLQKELKSITGSAPKYCQHLNAYEFNANFQTLYDVAFHSRTIESLKVQVGKKFNAHDDKQLLMGLKTVPFHLFWDADPMSVPDVRLSVNYSTIQPPHAKRVVEDYIYSLPVLKEYKRIQLSAAGLARISEVQRVLAGQLEAKMDKKLLREQEQQMLIQSGSENYKRGARSILKRQDSDIVQSEVKPLVFDVDIQRNFGRVYTPVNLMPMYKHGWKKRVGWAPIKESIAACMLIASEILKNTGQGPEGKVVKLWDPFCGSSTILLEALSMALNTPVRQEHEKWFNFYRWPLLKKQTASINQYLSDNFSKPPPVSVKILGSDISLQAINYSIENFKNSGLFSNGHLPSNSSSFIKRNPRHQIYSVVQNKIELVAQDFQTTGKHILTQPGFNIVTNIPYIGHRSSEHMQNNQILSVYKRFADFLSNNLTRLGEVFVVMPIPGNNYDPYHFISISKTLSWSLVDTFDSGGLKVGFYRLDKQRCSQVHLIGYELPYMSQSNLQRKIQRAVALNSPNSALPVSASQQKQVAEIPHELPKYLIPKKPKGSHVKLREWKRKMKSLTQSYSKFERLRIYHNKMTGFIREKVVNKLARRGQDWRIKNTNTLGADKLLQYQDEIRKAFDKKIQNAIQKDHEQKLQKQKNREKKKGIKRVHKKW